jgi:large subunit ribosomal protein L32e
VSDCSSAAAADAEAMDLQDINGISEHRAKTLRHAGFESVADLRDASHEEIAGIEGFGDALATRIKEQVGDGRAE